MSKIIVTIGISGAQKSTWASDYISKNKDWRRVNRDNLREELTGLKAHEYNKNPDSVVEKQLNDLQHEQIKYFLNKGFNVIIDNTHLKKSYIDDILFKYNFLADVELKWFYANVKYSQKLVAMRDFNFDIESDYSEYSQHVGYIERQQGQFDILRKQITQDYYNQINTFVAINKALPQAIICDLDGTLAESYIGHHSDKWHFDRDYSKDHIISPVQKLIHQFEKDYQIIFVSGREDKYKQMTEDFLYKAKIDKYQLFMRKTGDNRRDSVVKEEIFNTYIRDKYYINFSIDDRLQVVEECWEKLGIYTFCVNQGRVRY